MKSALPLLAFAALFGSEMAHAQTADYPIVRARWHVSPTGTVPAHPVYINNEMPPWCDQPTFDAISVWNSAGSRFTFAFVGWTDTRIGQDSAPKRVLIQANTFADKSTVMRMISTKTYWYSIPEFADADIEVDADRLYLAAPGQYDAGLFHCQYNSLQGRYDYQTVVGHELGHAAGLGHGDGVNPGSTCQLYWKVATGTTKRVLCAGEKTQFRNLYDYQINPRTPR